MASPSLSSHRTARGAGLASPEVAGHVSLSRAGIGDNSGPPEILVVDHEYDELADLICGAARSTPGLALLWQELDRATILSAGRLPRDVVRIGSQVFFTELAAGEHRSVRLLLPPEAIGPVRASITSTLGAALLGLQPGEVFAWTGSDGAGRRIRVDQVETPFRPRLQRGTRGLFRRAHDAADGALFGGPDTPVAGAALSAA